MALGCCGSFVGWYFAGFWGALDEGNAKQLAMRVIFASPTAHREAETAKAHRG